MTTPIVLDDSIRIVEFVNALAAAGLCLRGDLKGGLTVTTLRAARTDEDKPHLSGSGAGSALYTCHDCFHIGPAAPEQEWMLEYRDGKLENVYGSVCECGSGEIYEVGEPA